MYIKKILLFISITGLVILSIFSYFVYVTMFVSNTNFNNEIAYVYVYTDQTFEELKQDLYPVLKNVNSFERLANRKGYDKTLKSGKFAIKKGMNNNQIINTLRSSKLTVDVIFNNIDNEYELAGKISKQIEADSLSLLNSFKDFFLPLDSIERSIVFSNLSKFSDNSKVLSLLYFISFILYLIFSKKPSIIIPSIE